MYLYSISTFDNPISTTPNIQYYKKANIVESAEMASIFQQNRTQKNRQRKPVCTIEKT